MLKLKHTVPALVIGLATSGSALADSSVYNLGGLIHQVVNVQQAIKLEQEWAIASIQAGNMVGAQNNIVNAGEIRQIVEAAEATLSQDKTLGSTQALNAVVAGNPGTNIPGF